MPQPAFFCEVCHTRISDEKVAQRGYLRGRIPAHITCTRQHDAERRKRAGEYKKMSNLGNAARRVAVAESNKANPRRRKKGDLNGHNNESNRV